MNTEQKFALHNFIIGSRVKPSMQVKQFERSGEKLVQFWGLHVAFALVPKYITKPGLQIRHESPLRLSCWQKLARQVPSGNKENPV